MGHLLFIVMVLGAGLLHTALSGMPVDQIVTFRGLEYTLWVLSAVTGLILIADNIKND